MLKLDLGAGEISPPGFTPVGRRHGTEIYPLGYTDESADEIRASHVLEHFPHGIVDDVLKDWVRVLKKGGRIRIAVPDFAKVAKDYLDGAMQPTEMYVCGGQEDENDFHKALFDRNRLRRMIAANNLVLVRPWKSEIQDCASYPISLNLEGYKPHRPKLKISGAMSVPRLGFMDNMFCAMEAAIPCGIKFRKHGGAFWDQSLTNVFEKILEEDDPDYILTLDYDSIFTPAHLAHLIQICMLHSDVDALAPIQSSRHLPTALFTVAAAAGENAPSVNRTEFDAETMPVETAHFGLTLIRADKLKALPKPWFIAKPSPGGDWHEGHLDSDINFWRGWKAAGNSLHIATRVPIGHAELMVRWPDVNLRVFYQLMTDFQKKGTPGEVWK